MKEYSIIIKNQKNKIIRQYNCYFENDINKLHKILVKRYSPCTVIINKINKQVKR